MRIIKHRDDWSDFKNIQNKREHRAYDAKIGFCDKFFGQRFVNYLGPTFYNTLPVDIKRDVVQNNSKVKKSVYKWILSTCE